MSSRSVVRYILICDGCGAPHGAPSGYRSAVEMRAAAYADGWRYPTRVRGDGSPGTSASDVCPSCLPDWKAVPMRDGRVSNRYLRQSEEL